MRKLETHPLLLIPGWTGFNIKVCDRVVVVESTISYFDIIDSPATDLKIAYEVLSQGCEIKQRLQLNAFVCVFDQTFYAIRFRELAVQSDVVAEGSVDKALYGKQYNQAVRLHKCVYEAVMRLLLNLQSSHYRS